MSINGNIKKKNKEKRSARGLFGIGAWCAWRARAGLSVWTDEWMCACVGRARRVHVRTPVPFPRLHLDLIWSGCDPNPAGPTRNEKLPFCEASSSGRCAARPLGRRQRRGPGGPETGPMGPGAQKWWIDQIDEAGVVLSHWLSRRFWSEPGPRVPPPSALRNEGGGWMSCRPSRGSWKQMGSLSWILVWYLLTRVPPGLKALYSPPPN